MANQAHAYRLLPSPSPVVTDAPGRQTVAGIAQRDRRQASGTQCDRAGSRLQGMTSREQHLVEAPQAPMAVPVLLRARCHIADSVDHHRKPPIQPGIVTLLRRRPLNDIVNLVANIDTGL